MRHASRVPQGVRRRRSRRFRPQSPQKKEYPSNTHYLIRCLIPMANIPHKTKDRQTSLSLLLGVASRDELLAARLSRAARGSAAAKPTLSPALSSERRMPSEHAFSFSLSQPYGEYPSCKFYRLHREVGALFVGGYRRFAQGGSKNRAFSTVFPYFMVKRNRMVDKIRCGRRECVRFPLARVVARSHTATRRTEHER